MIQCTGLAGIGFIDLNDGNTGQICLVGDKVEHDLMRNADEVLVVFLAHIGRALPVLVLANDDCICFTAQRIIYYTLGGFMSKLSDLVIAPVGQSDHVLGFLVDRLFALFGIDHSF